MVRLGLQRVVGGAGHCANADLWQTDWRQFAVEKRVRGAPRRLRPLLGQVRRAPGEAVRRLAVSRHDNHACDRARSVCQSAAPCLRSCGLWPNPWLADCTIDGVYERFAFGLCAIALVLSETGQNKLIPTKNETVSILAVGSGGARGLF